MSQTEKEFKLFESLLNRGGYVLDFSNAKFDEFTARSVGIPIQDYYGLSKGKSLSAFLHDTSIAEGNKWKLLEDFLKYYQVSYKLEYNPDLSEDDYIPEIHAYGVKYNEGYSRLYRQCLSIIEKHKGINSATADQVKDLKDRVFSNEYLHQEINEMMAEITTNPTDAIGKAKELIESCCKTILDEMGIQSDKRWDFIAITNKVLEELKLTPKAIPETDPVNEQLKAICGNLRGIVSKMAEIRNAYGSGHGKDDEYVGLESRHAKLAVACSSAFCTFIWETWETKRSK